MTKKSPVHYASDFGLDVAENDDSMFQWFTLCYLFGKPIQSEIAVDTWKLLRSKGYDTPWAFTQGKNRKLVRIFYQGRYTRYAESTARGMTRCMEELIKWYDGSLTLMLEQSPNEDDFSKQLQTLYGVGPKVAEIFMRETSELFARRVE